MRGFALRDVVIGCVIVGTVLVFVETHLAGIQATSRGAFCQTNQRQIGIALNMYAADYDGRLPMDAGRFQGLIGATRPYMRNDSRYTCPETGRSAEMVPVGYRVPPLYAGRPIVGGWPDPYLHGLIAEPNRTILLFESPTDTGTEITPTYRHSGGAICLMLTGQTAWEEDLRPR